MSETTTRRRNTKKIHDEIKVQRATQIHFQTPRGEAACGNRRAAIASCNPAEVTCERCLVSPAFQQATR